MARAVLTIFLGSFIMAIIALHALEIQGSYFELAVVATLITTGLTAGICMATLLTAPT